MTQITLHTCRTLLILGLMPLVPCTATNGHGDDAGHGQPRLKNGIGHPIEHAVWRHLGGPPGGRGYDIRHRWAAPDTWLVTDTFSGVSISHDRGVTWTPSNDGMAIPVRSGANDVYSLTVDPNDAQIVWAGTTEPGHIYMSTDAGQSWSRADQQVLGLQGETLTLGSGYGFRGFTVEPGNSDVVYAQSHVFGYRLLADGDMTQYDLDRDVQGGRIFRTTDRGVTWRLIWEGRALARNLVIDPDDTDILWATTGIQDIRALDYPIPPDTATGLDCGGAGLLRSTDGGTTWQELSHHTGISEINSTTLGTIDMSPIDPDTIIVGGGSDMCPTEPPDVDQHGGVYLTHNGGITWALVLEDDIISSVDFCDLDPERVYAVSKNALHRSDDGGLTWSTFTSPDIRGWGPDGVVTGFPIDTETDPSDCDRLLVNTYTGGVFLSTDGGETFQLSSQGYAGSFISGLWVNPSDPSRVLVSSEMAPFEGLITADQTEWHGLLERPLEYGTAMLAASASYPSQATDLLVATPGKIAPTGPLAIYRRTPTGGWVEHQPTLLNSDHLEPLKITDIRYAPGDRLRVYAATAEVAEYSDSPGEGGAGLLYSSDGGSTWNNSVDFHENGFMRVAVHPTDPLWAWAVGIDGVGVVSTLDGGVNWSAMASPGFSTCNAVALPPGDPTHPWVGGDGGVKAWDGAAWQPRTTGLPALAHVSVITFDHAHPGVLYLGTFYHGVFYSTDFGSSFQRLDIDLPRLRGEPLSVEHLALSDDGSVLYAGGHSAGLWGLVIPYDTFEGLIFADDFESGDTSAWSGG